MANPEPQPSRVNSREWTKPILDPAAMVLDLETYQSGSIIGTLNSTAGGMDAHNINLPEAVVGVWFIIVGGNKNTFINRDGTDTITMPDGGTGNTSINCQLQPFMMRISCEVGGVWTVEHCRGDGVIADVSGWYFGDGVFESVDGTRSAQLKGESGNTENNPSGSSYFFGSNNEVASGAYRSSVAGEYAKAFWRRGAYRASNARGEYGVGSAQALDGLALSAATTGIVSESYLSDSDIFGVHVMEIEDDRFYGVEAIVVAKNDEVTNEAVMWKLEFAVLGGHSSAPTLVGKNIIRIAETANGDEAIWGVDVEIVGSSPYYIGIKVMGEAGGATILWSGNIRDAEVAGYSPPA